MMEFNTKHQIAIIEATPDFVGYADAKTRRLLYVNLAGRIMVNLSPDEDVTQFKISDIYPEWANTLIEQEIFPVAIKNGVWQGECAFLSRNGTEIPVAMVLIAHKGTDGEVEMFYTISRDITEKKKAEQTLRESEEKYRAFFQFAADPIFIVDLQGRIVSVNATACDIYGYQPQEFLFMHISLLNAEAERKNVQGRMEAILDKGALQFETIHLHKNGNPIYLEINARRVTWEGQVANMAICRDITQRKYAEVALYENEERFRKLGEAAFEGIAITEQGQVLDVNLQLAHMLGYTIGEMVGKPIMGFIAPESRAIVQENIRNKNEKVYEHFMLRKDGNTCYVEVHGRMMDWKGSLLRVTTLHDITERKQLEERVREKDIQFRKLSANVSDLIFQFTRRPDGRYCVPIASEGIKNIFGCLPQDVIDDFTPILNAVFPEDAARFMNDIENSAKHLTHLTSEFRVKIPGRPIQWIYSKSGPEKLADGSVTWFGFNTDITQRKQLEEELQKTQKLESLGLLAGGIAHDFNNLLGGMFGYVELAKICLEENSPNEAKEALTKAFEVLDRTKALTLQLLTFAKGGAPIRKTIHLSQLIIKWSQFSLSGSKVTVDFDLDEDFWLCYCDENQIGQVIDNIVINAKQAMPLGGKIHISGKNVSFLEPSRGAERQVGDFLKISFKDQGYGIAQEHLVRIFDPFFTTKTFGNGLGLATVFSIVKRHGGWIEVESELGKGTTFHVFLKASPTAKSEEPIIRGDKHQGRGRALIMDDEDFLLKIEAAMLASMGYEVVEARNGQEALALFTQAYEIGKGFVLTLLDLTIPNGMGGMETIKAIRKIDPIAVVIVSSGYSDDFVMMNPAAYGFTDKLSKPFRRSELTELLQKHLKKSGQSIL